MQRPLWIALVGAFAIAFPAAADPCKAIPDKGPAPAWIKPGARFSGVVRYIVDGDGLCVGKTADPATWVEVRLADFDAPELQTAEGRAAKAAMSRIAAGRAVQCVVTPGRNGRAVNYDRVFATCTLGGRSIRELMKAAGVGEGGN
jgi:micrococcal nuclease